MRMSYHIKELMVGGLISKRVLFSLKTTKLDSFVLSEREKLKAY